jgi:hypothetical protein
MPPPDASGRELDTGIARDSVADINPQPLFDPPPADVDVDEPDMDELMALEDMERDGRRDGGAAAGGHGPLRDAEGWEGLHH